MVNFVAPNLIVYKGYKEMQKEVLRCRKCSAPYHYEKKRNWLGRTLLSFLPVRRYFCAKCLKDRYRLITDEQLKAYKRV